VAGLPGIGLLGVTFGYLVAMDSPARHADSDFHWGTTLWHEMAHVFTLEATNHLVPRWFSEGVSVYEEWTTGPLKGRHIPPQVFKAIKEGKFLPIADLDRGFIRPAYEQQVIVSYMQAGLTCEYVAGRFGQSGLKAMLDQFGAGKTTAQAVEGALKITPAEFDKDFKAYVEAQLGTVIAQFEPWQHALAETSEAVRMKDWRLVTAKASQAIELFPDFVDQGSPYIAKARAHRELKETALLTSTLLEYRKRGGSDPDALLSLAAALGEANRADDAPALATGRGDDHRDARCREDAAFGTDKDAHAV